MLLGEGVKSCLANSPTVQLPVTGNRQLVSGQNPERYAIARYQFSKRLHNAVLVERADTDGQSYQGSLAVVLNVANGCGLDPRYAVERMLYLAEFNSSPPYLNLIVPSTVKAEQSVSSHRA
jgi:hypothetical protein